MKDRIGFPGETLTCLFEPVRASVVIVSARLRSQTPREKAWFPPCSTWTQEPRFSKLCGDPPTSTGSQMSKPNPVPLSKTMVALAVELKR
jgi:hypothetical protein